MYKCTPADAKETPLALFEQFSRFVAPSQIMTDRGSHFVNQVKSEFLADVESEHCLAIAYFKGTLLLKQINKEDLVVCPKTVLGFNCNQITCIRYNWKQISF